MSFFKYWILSTLLIIFIINESFALVDYSGGPSSNFSFSKNKTNLASRATSSKRPRRKRTSYSTTSKQSPSFSKYFSFGTGYEKLDLETDTTDGKIDKYNFSARVTTNYNFFASINYWMAATSLGGDIGQSEYQSGDPELVIGMNWLEFGQAHDRMTIDLYAGLTFGNKESKLASSRDDKFFGLETTKRFLNLVLGLGYELRLSEAPANSTEVEIGNIQKLAAAIGATISHDIKFQISATSVTIFSSGNTEGQNRLTKDIKYTQITPKLILGVTSTLEMEMGATFRSNRRLEGTTLIDARLMGLRGSYGNSIFTGLKFSL